MKSSDESAGRKQHWLVRYAPLWLIPAAMFLALLLGEGLLRLHPELLPERAQIKRLFQLQTPVISIADPYLGYVYPPYYKTEIKTLDFSFEVESDEHGFRNASPWPAKADIVIVGDSMVYGWGVAKEQAWVNRVAGRLPGKRIVNLGMPGTSPQQYLRYFERFGLGLKPKLLVFGIFAGNDFVGDDIFNSWLEAGSPVNFDEWRFYGGKPPDRIRGVLEHSLVLLLIKTVVAGIGESYGSKTVTAGEGERLHLVPAVYKRAMRLNDPSSPAFRSVVQATVETRDLARAHGIDFLAVLFPTKEAVYLPLHDAEFPSLNSPLEETLAAEGIEVVNLTEAMQRGAAGGQKLFFRIDGHPNVAGNRVIAAAMQERLGAGDEDLAKTTRGDD